MQAIISAPSNIFNFVRNLTVVRFSFLTAVITALVSLGLMATGSTWVAMGLGLLTVFSILWYCIAVEDTIKIYGQPLWW